MSATVINHQSPESRHGVVSAMMTGSVPKSTMSGVAKAPSAPMATDIALPPENLRNTGQLCPATAASATNASVASPRPSTRSPTTYTGIHPLTKTSNSATGTIHTLPTCVEMLDAPTLPEPYVRMSMPPTHFAMR